MKEEEDVATIRRRNALWLIAALATVAVCIQNWMAMLAFGWGLLHGAGLAALFAFLPGGIGIALIWGGYRYGTRSRRRYTVPLFGAFAVGILLLYEAILPSTPLGDWRLHRALEAAEVSNVRDEVLRSARGNPIGITVRFDVVFPRRVQGRVSGSTLGPADRTLPIPLQIDKRYGLEVAPVPATRDGQDVFEPGVRYTVTSHIMPGFVSYDHRTHEVCRRLSDAVLKSDFQSELALSRNVKLRGAAILTAGESIHVYKPFVLVHEYDLEAINQTIVIEGDRRCGQ